MPTSKDLLKLVETNRSVYVESAVKKLSEEYGVAKGKTASAEAAWRSRIASDLQKVCNKHNLSLVCKGEFINAEKRNMFRSEELSVHETTNIPSDVARCRRNERLADAAKKKATEKARKLLNDLESSIMLDGPTDKNVDAVRKIVASVSEASNAR